MEWRNVNVLSESVAQILFIPCMRDEMGIVDDRDAYNV